MRGQLDVPSMVLFCSVMLAVLCCSALLAVLCRSALFKGTDLSVSNHTMCRKEPRRNGPRPNHPSLSPI
jgi:hypothetical protein